MPGGQAPHAPLTIEVPEFDTDGRYQINWSGVSGASGYTLQEKTGSGGWNTVYSGNATSYTRSGRPSNTYYYRIRAHNSHGASSYRDTRPVSVTISLSPPPIPTGLTSPSSDTDGWFTVSWHAASTASSYQLQYRKSTSSVWLTGTTTSSTSYADSYTNGTWYFRVRACNAGGCSAYSGTDSTTVRIKNTGGGL